MATTTIFRRLRRTLLAVALLAILPAATGCNVRLLNVLLPDFDQSSVDGVQVWRLDDATGEPAAAGVLEFLGTSVVQSTEGPVELIEYQIVDVDGTRTESVYAQVFRNEGEEENVQVHLFFSPNAEAGLFKVSSYNEAGSSPLSAEAVELL